MKPYADDDDVYDEDDDDLLIIKGNEGWIESRSDEQLWLSKRRQQKNIYLLL